jgi:putative membrane protein insertion efficiency factor
MRALALLLIRAYQRLISPAFRGHCRFTPSCSEYAHQAIARHGLKKGTWLAVLRLARCHPLGSSGYDPVPGPTAEKAR